MVIDFHTHAFPATVAPKAMANLIAGVQAQRGFTPVSIHDGTVEGLLSTMDGIDMSVVMPIATNARGSDGINRFAMSLQSKSIRSFASIHPAQADWESALEKIAAEGFRGIKLHPEFQGFFVDEPLCLRVLQKCEQLGLYTTIHAGRDVGKPEPVHCTPLRLKHVMEHVSGAHIIAAHMGGYELWDDVERELVGSPMLLDTALTAHRLPPEQYLRIIRAHGADHILFGSDSPWEDPHATLHTLRSLGLTAEELSLIESGNALRILQIAP